MAKRNKRQPPSDPQEIDNAQMIAGLQALALGIRLVGLDGLRSGAIKFNGAEKPQC